LKFPLSPKTVSVIIVVALILMALTALDAWARPLKLCDVCDGFTVSKRGDDVLIRCPGQTEPWMTFKNCKSPRVTRKGNNVTVTCVW